MYKSIKMKIFMLICIMGGYQNSIAALGIGSVGAADHDISSSSYDLDAEQSKAKYDPRILTKEFQDKILSTERAASCITDNIKYEHGQKVERSDPCEVCLCVDGEVFCWWKKCDIQKWKLVPNKGKHRKLKKPFKKYNHKNAYNKNREKFKQSKNLSKKILRFPEHLPATLHFEFNQNDKSELMQQPNNLKNETSTNNLSNLHQQQQNNNDVKKMTIETSSAIISEIVTSNPNTIISDLKNLFNPVQQHQEKKDESSTLLLTTTSQQNNMNGIGTERINSIPDRKCIVMGVSYEVGSILPQETGNCLQCICTIDSKITCNPHNCPPIILPDLFDATGY